MTHYYGYGWQSDNYWTRDPSGYSVHLGNGHVIETPITATSTSYVACVKYY